MYIVLLHHFYTNTVCYSHIENDFTHSTVTVEIPANRFFFDLPYFFSVSDDNIDEFNQSFAIVAEIGQDVPDTPTNFSCFQTAAEQTECLGRRGATVIRIIDDDCKFGMNIL